MNPKTKTFKSGLGVKAQRYWKDESHWYRIVSECEVITIYISYDQKEATIHRYCSLKNVSLFLGELMDGNKNNYCELTEKEYKTTLKLAIKILNK